MATAVSNHFKYMQDKGDIDFDTDSFKCCLMASGFTFDVDAHATWANVSASELATGNGYTQNTKVLPASPVITEDDANNRSNVAWDNVSWTASGGSIGPTPGAIVYDDTTADDTVVGFLDFITERTATDGGTFVISNINKRTT